MHNVESARMAVLLKIVPPVEKWTQIQLRWGAEEGMSRRSKCVPRPYHCQLVFSLDEQAMPLDSAENSRKLLPRRSKLPTNIALRRRFYRPACFLGLVLLFSGCNRSAQQPAESAAATEPEPESTAVESVLRSSADYQNGSTSTCGTPAMCTQAMQPSTANSAASDTSASRRTTSRTDNCPGRGRS